MVKIKKKQTLRGQLREMAIGDSAEINQRKTGYKPEIVRQAISRMKKDGYLFECTEKGLVDAIRITRLQ
jgi:DNA-binding transcriptional regulator PaaX